MKSTVLIKLVEKNKLNLCRFFDSEYQLKQISLYLPFLLKQARIVRLEVISNILDILDRGYYYEKKH